MFVTTKIILVSVFVSSLVVAGTVSAVCETHGVWRHVCYVVLASPLGVFGWEGLITGITSTVLVVLSPILLKA